MGQGIATFAGFFALQLTFAAIERRLHGKPPTGHLLVWVAHPTVLHTLHDWGIFVVSEAHLLVPGH